MKLSFQKQDILFIVIIVSINSYAQNLESHIWEDRLLICITEEPENKTYLKQIDLLRQHKIGLKERKLKVYHGIPERYKLGLFTKDWQNSNKLYRNYHTTNIDFEIILIGLDGGIKLRQSSLLSIEMLFGTIDTMPIRKVEMEQKKNLKDD